MTTIYSQRFNLFKNNKIKSGEIEVCYKACGRETGQNSTLIFTDKSCKKILKENIAQNNNNSKINKTKKNK